MAQAVPVRVRLSAPTVLNQTLQSIHWSVLVFRSYLKSFMNFLVTQKNDEMKLAIFAHPIDK